MSSSTRKNSAASRRTKLILVLGGVLAALATFLIVWLAHPRKDRSPGPDSTAAVARAVADLRDVAGDVQWRTGAGSWQDAAEGQPLGAADSVRTGVDGSAMIAFVDGGWLKLKPRTQLDLADVAGKYALQLGQGEIELSAERPGGKGFRLRMGDADDYVVVEGGRARLTRVPEGVEVRMIIGAATINQGGQTRSLEEGGAFLLRIGKPRLVRRESIATKLTDRKRRSLVRPPSAEKYERVGKRTTAILPGTSLQIATGGSELTDAAGGRIVLRRGSWAVFDGTYRTGKGREGSISLEAGEARVIMARGFASGAVQEVLTAQASVEVTARGTHVDAVVTARSRSSRVEVRLGQAEVTVGKVRALIRAGHAVTVGEDGKLSEPEPLPLPRIFAREGARTRVFYDRSISHIGFGWEQQQEGERAFLELARDAGFEDRLFREPMDGLTFSYRGFTPGKYHWRIWRRALAGDEEKAGPTGEIEIKRDPVSRVSSTGPLTNVVRDTGIQTTILFQGEVPALTFSWNAVKRAGSYRVRVYQEDDLERAIIDNRVAATRMILATGRLKEGTYYWYQAARDGAGREFKSSEMNKLVIVFDNAAHLLRIDAPRPGQRSRRGKVRIEGLATRGAKLTVNGKPVQVTSSGRFDETVTGLMRRPKLVFRLHKGGMGDVYFVRHLR